MPPELLIEFKIPIPGCGQWRHVKATTRLRVFTGCDPYGNYRPYFVSVNAWNIAVGAIWYAANSMVEAVETGIKEYNRSRGKKS